MAATVLEALRILHETDGAITQHISQGVFYNAPKERLNISKGGVCILDFKGRIYEKTTESIHQHTRIDMIYFHRHLEVLDQIVYPWVMERFDDTEYSVENQGPVQLDGAYVVSVDVAPEGEAVMMGMESEKTKDCDHIFSLLVPIKVWSQHPRARSE